MRKISKRRIFSVMAIFGLAATVVCAIKDTMNAKEAVEEKEPQTAFEKVKTAAPKYIRTAIAVILTVLCIVVADKISTKEITAATGIGIAATNRYHHYRKKVKEIVGEEVEEQIYRETVSNDFSISPLIPYDMSGDCVRKFLFKDMESGVEFYSTIEQVQAAMYHLNRQFQANGEILYSEWFKFLGIKPPKSILDRIDNKGWNVSYYIEEQGYEFVWIDFFVNYVANPKGNKEPYYELYFDVGPCVEALEY